MNVFYLQDRRNKTSEGVCPDNLLPGVPETLIRQCFYRSSENEKDSGKSLSLDYSSELVANAFGWFIARPQLFPPLPGLEDYCFGAESIDLNRCIPYPWPGGRHQTFDAIVETSTHLIGINSERGEPFLGRKKPQFSAAFDQDVWGDYMGPYLDLRDQLRSGSLQYRYLDAAQLVKQAFALSIHSARTGKLPILFYVFDQPAELEGRIVSIENLAGHLEEIYDFQYRVEGAQVAFFRADYFDWLDNWDEGQSSVQRHGENVLRYLIRSKKRASRG